MNAFVHDEVARAMWWTRDNDRQFLPQWSPTHVKIFNALGDSKINDDEIFGCGLKINPRNIRTS